jgi:hypothetical protein
MNLKIGDDFCPECGRMKATPGRDIGDGDRARRAIEAARAAGLRPAEPRPAGLHDAERLALKRRDRKSQNSSGTGGRMRRLVDVLRTIDAILTFRLLSGLLATGGTFLAIAEGGVSPDLIVLLSIACGVLSLKEEW